MDKNETMSVWKSTSFIIAMMALIFGFAAITVAKASELDKMTNQMFNTSVQIGNWCSGTLIKSARDNETGDVETLVLTAKHCAGEIKDSTPIRIFNYNDQNRLTSTVEYRATVMRTSWQSDLSLITLRDTSTYFGNRLAKIAPKDAKLTFGDSVHMVGFPAGLSMTYTVGHLGFVEDDLFKDLSKSGEFFRATPDGIGGSSGSPMFRQNEDGDYEVIGVLTGGWGNMLTSYPFMKLFTPLNEIHEFLEQARLKPEDFLRQ